MLAFPHNGMIVFEMQDKKIEHISFPTQWSVVVQDAIVFVQDGKKAQTSFLLQWNNVVRDEFVLVQDGQLPRVSFPHHGMILFEMRLFLCKGKDNMP
jgi:hypothetical protein